MEVKEGVDPRSLDWHMFVALPVIDHIFTTHGFECTLTSTREGDHGEWSWHKCGMAADFRTHGLSLGEVTVLAEDIRQGLGRPYQVVIEPTHIHVECDLRANPDYVGKWPL